MDGSELNECAEALTKGNMAHECWRGPIVVMRQPGVADDPMVYEDVKAEDLGIAVDYLLWYLSGKRGV